MKAGAFLKNSVQAAEYERLIAAVRTGRYSLLLGTGFSDGGEDVHGDAMSLMANYLELPIGYALLAKVVKTADSKPIEGRYL